MDTDAHRWQTVINDIAEADIEAAYQHLSAFVAPDRLEEWTRDLFLTLDSIGDFPGPHSYPVDEEASKRRGREIRRLLYRGPRQKPLSVVYRAFYTMIPPAEGEAEGIILIIRVLHGSAIWPGESED